MLCIEYYSVPSANATRQFGPGATAISGPENPDMAGETIWVQHVETSWTVRVNRLTRYKIYKAITRPY